jgi:hypothetical protein
MASHVIVPDSIRWTASEFRSPTYLEAIESLVSLTHTFSRDNRITAIALFEQGMDTEKGFSRLKGRIKWKPSEKSGESQGKPILYAAMQPTQPTSQASMTGGGGNVGTSGKVSNSKNVGDNGAQRLENDICEEHDLVESMTLEKMSKGNLGIICSETQGLWEAAWEKLDEKEKLALQSGQPKMLESTSPALQAVENVIKMTEERYKEHQKGGWVIGKRNGDENENDKGDNKQGVNLRDAFFKILESALTCKNLIDAGLKFDPTRYGEK